MKRAFVPDSSDGRLAFFHEGKAEKRAALHGVLEGFAFVSGLGDFLKFANSFFEQTHFSEGDTEIVVRFEILFLATHFAEFGAKFVEDFFEGTGFGVLRWWRCGYGRRGRRFHGRRRWREASRSARFGGNRSELIDAEFVDLADHIREELIRG